MDNYNKALNSQKIAQEVDRNIQKQTEEKKENKADSGKKSEFTSNKVIKEAKTNVKEANTFKKQHVKETNTFKKQHVSVSKASVLPATQLPQTGNKTEIPVPAEQFEQIVGNVKIVLSKSFATIFTVSNALPPPKPKIISAS